MTNLLIKPARPEFNQDIEYKRLTLTSVGERPEVISLLKKSYKAPRIGNTISPHVVFLLAGYERPRTNREQFINKLFILDVKKSANPEKIEYYRRKGERADGTGGGLIIGYYLPSELPKPANHELQVLEYSSDGNGRDAYSPWRAQVVYHARQQEGVIDPISKVVEDEEKNSLRARIAELEAMHNESKTTDEAAAIGATGEPDGAGDQSPRSLESEGASTDKATNGSGKTGKASRS